MIAGYVAKIDVGLKQNPAYGIGVNMHKCYGEGYPPGGIVCLCRRGEDHDESLFDVSVDEEWADEE